MWYFNLKVLITGGAGFIGSNLADHFSKEGQRIIIYDNLSRPGVEYNLRWLKKNRNIDFVKADVRDIEALIKNAKDADIIFHTAAQTAVTTSLKDPIQDFEANALGTLNVLETARRSKTDLAS